MSVLEPEIVAPEYEILDESTAKVVEEFEEESKILDTFKDEEERAEAYAEMILGNLGQYDDDYDYPEDDD